MYISYRLKADRDSAAAREKGREELLAVQAKQAEMQKEHALLLRRAEEKAKEVEENAQKALEEEKMKREVIEEEQRVLQSKV